MRKSRADKGFRRGCHGSAFQKRCAGRRLFDYSAGQMGLAVGHQRLVLFFDHSSHSHQVTEHVRGAFTVCIAPALAYPDYSRTGCLGGRAGKYFSAISFQKF